MLLHLRETVILIPPREPQTLYLGNAELSLKELTFVQIVKKIPVVCGSEEFIYFFFFSQESSIPNKLAEAGTPLALILKVIRSKSGLYTGSSDALECCASASN